MDQEQKPTKETRFRESAENDLRDPEYLKAQLVDGISDLPEEERQVIFDALALSQKAHEKQTRDEGSPYIVHPLRVAMESIKHFKKPDAASIVIALLHDVIEDSDVSYEDLHEKFGEEIANTVRNLSKDKKLPKKERFEEYHKRLEILPERDLQMKLLDRLDNLRSLHLSPTQNKRIAYIKQTERFYLPLAKKINPEIYAEMLNLLDALKSQK